MDLPCTSTSLLPCLKLACITVVDNGAILHSGSLAKFSGSKEFFIIKAFGNNVPKVIYNPAVKVFKVRYSGKLA